MRMTKHTSIQTRQSNRRHNKSRISRARKTMVKIRAAVRSIRYLKLINAQLSWPRPRKLSNKQQ